MPLPDIVPNVTKKQRASILKPWLCTYLSPIVWCLPLAHVTALRLADCPRSVVPRFSASANACSPQSDSAAVARIPGVWVGQPVVDDPHVKFSALKAEHRLGALLDVRRRVPGDDDEDRPRIPERRPFHHTSPASGRSSPQDMHTSKELMQTAALRSNTFSGL